MSSCWPETATFHEAPPRMMKYCRICRESTPHETRCGDGVLATICIPCLSRELARQQDRD